MNMQTSLSKISDSMQVPLSYESGYIKGEVYGTISTSLGFSFPLRLKAVKLFYNEQCGVLFHVSGDLYMVVSHDPQRGGLCALLIDASKLVMDGVKTPPDLFISKRMNLREVLSALSGSVVRAFHYTNSRWRPLSLPK